jgi:hypothetical protein
VIYNTRHACRPLEIKENHKVAVNQFYDSYKNIFDSISTVCEENFQLVIDELTDTKNPLNKRKSRSEISQSEYITKSENFFKVLTAVKKNCDNATDSDAMRLVQNENGYCRSINSQSSEVIKLDIFFNLLKNINPTSSEYNQNYFVYNRVVTEFNPKPTDLLYQQQYLDKNYLPELYCPLLPYLIDEIKTTKEKIASSNIEKIQECNYIQHDLLNATYHEIIKDLGPVGEL